MTLKTQKKIAAKQLKCGVNRIWLDSSRIGDVKQAITTLDVNALIKDGAIKAMQKKGVSKGRKRKRLKQIKKGRRKGHGSREGKKSLKKKLWMKKIRAIRNNLKELKNTKRITVPTYKDLYRKAKSGFFKNKAHLKIYLERNDLYVSQTKKKD